MFAWSRLEIWLASVLAALIVIGGTAHLVLNARQGPRPIIVEAHGVGADESRAAGGNESVEGRDGSNPGGQDVGKETVGREDAVEIEGESVADDGRLGPATDEGDLLGNDDGDIGGAAADGEADRLPAYDDRININTAQPSELERLPGIGPALAARIAAYREEWGPFDAVEDIMEVSGIGPVKFANMRHLLKVR